MWYVGSGSERGHGGPRSFAAGGLQRHWSVQADVLVTEEDLHSLHGAVTALSAGTGSAFL